jgi:hypothetical protein
MTKVYEISHVDTTEEILQSSAVPGYSMKGWRRFRINYREKGTDFSNLEGTLYFPPGFDPFPLLDEVCDRLNNVNRRD